MNGIPQCEALTRLSVSAGRLPLVGARLRSTHSLVPPTAWIGAAIHEGLMALEEFDGGVEGHAMPYLASIMAGGNPLVRGRSAVARPLLRGSRYQARPVETYLAITPDGGSPSMVLGGTTEAYRDHVLCVAGRVVSAFPELDASGGRQSSAGLFCDPRRYQRRGRSFSKTYETSVLHVVNITHGDKYGPSFT